MKSRRASFAVTVAVAVAVACLLVPTAAFAGTYVLDEANIIDDAAEVRIEELSARLEAATPGAQVAVLTVDSLEGSAIEEFAEERFEQLGVGSDDEDNGVLLAIAVQDRKMRIEVGYGLEGALPDARAGDILDADLTPRFKEGDFTGGVERAHGRIVGIVAQEYGVTLEGSEEPKTVQVEAPTWLPLLMVGVFLVIVVILVSIAMRRGRGAFGDGAFVGAGDSGGGLGGSDSDGGGFGGGDSGGGGASGDW